jgi:hypothetical protein
MSEHRLSAMTFVPLREFWPDEAKDFTPWLASQNNLNLLARAVNLEFSLKAIESRSGRYRLDLLCTTPDGRNVLIENQIGPSDHRHLGQLISYASWFGRSVVIWISDQFSDEHISAVEWLNDSTPDGNDFFAVEIYLARIEQSPLAAFFNVVAKPNGWRRERKYQVNAANAAIKQAKEYLLPTEIVQILMKPLFAGSALESFSVSDVVEMASRDFNAALEKNPIYAKIGLRVVELNGQPHIVLANSHPILAAELKRIRISQEDFTSNLRKLPNAVAGGGRRFAGHSARTTLIPVGVLTNLLHPDRKDTTSK